VQNVGAGSDRLRRSSLARVQIRAKRRVLSTGAACAAAVGAAALGGCGGRDRASPATSASTRASARTAAAPRAQGPPPALKGEHPCPAPARSFTCATLSVPLDHARPGGARLRLVVARERRARAPRGVLVLLAGGPGQAGLPLAGRLRERLGPAAAGYRLVLLDQRGTGAGALRCPALQRALGASDLTPVRAGVVAACARALGPRRAWFATSDTVADLEDLRRGLGAARLTLDGVSYGSFVAERYALAHPDRVARVVLDSVVPQDGVDPLDADGLAATGRVLRMVCRERRCGTDPVADLRRVVRRRHDGPALLDTLVALSIGRPRLAAVPRLLHAAAAGRDGGLDALVRAVHRAQAVPAPILSQGLHAATLCADLRAPWGGPEAPVAARRAALERAARRLAPAALGPFDRATATGNGIAATCAAWPPIRRPALAPGGPLRVPALLLAGDHDLSTPLAWARRELRRAPRGRLVVARGDGHSVQSRGRDPRVRRALVRFLGAPPGG
jgi:pimeloyl-ACP methyl ester carboxylesterase